MVNINKHRVTSRLLTAQTELHKQLTELSSGLIYSKLDFGVSGHFVDRICDRSMNSDVAISNTKYLVSNLLKKHFCRLIYEGELLNTTGQYRQMIVYHKSLIQPERNVAIGFSLTSKEVDEYLDAYIRYFRIRFRTYMIDYDQFDDEKLIFEV